MMDGNFGGSVASVKDSSQDWCALQARLRFPSPLQAKTSFRGRISCVASHHCARKRCVESKLEGAPKSGSLGAAYDRAEFMEHRRAMMFG